MELRNTGDGPQAKILEDVWRQTIAALPSDFGKLVYLASLRDANSGLYHHYGLENVYSSEECDEALRTSHLDVLQQWLEKSLEEQKEDVEHYLRSVEGDLPTILSNWETLQTYVGYLPIEASPATREWFLSDLKIILGLLQLSAWPAAPDPSA